MPTGIYKKEGRVLGKVLSRCKNCDNEIIAHSSRNKKFCNRGCYFKWKKKTWIRPEGFGCGNGNKFKKGMTPWNKGMKGYGSGSKNGSWIDGRTPLSQSIRTMETYNEWRYSIMTRDRFTCQECGSKKSGDLVVHHLVPFKDIFSKFIKEYNQFSVIEDKHILVRLAINYKDFWYKHIGITLCNSCHDMTKHNKR